MGEDSAASRLGGVGGVCNQTMTPLAHSNLWSSSDSADNDFDYTEESPGNGIYLSHLQLNYILTWHAA
ncbi:hypothetical protein PENSUB_5446 [Penicillium subrubescens]|uniref:Uncharacterized protein n=1 Tax=Penicillium subrubescens TaxID=1316194 RepID=A0A1Q5U9U0_9EURO|nr:hypothetical protein PENSUB_5446 [Penicillium subrubescens]